MAIRKVKKVEVSKENIIEQEERNRMMQTNNYPMNHNSFNNTVMEEHDRFNHESFFKTENLSSMATPIDLEIEIKTRTVAKEGEYYFKIISLNIEKDVLTPYGVKDKLVAEFYVNSIKNGEDLEYTLKQKYNISSSIKSDFYKLYTDLTGQSPSGKINLRDLLGVKGRCAIKHISMDNGDIFPKIVSINSEIYKDSSEVPAV